MRKRRYTGEKRERNGERRISIKTKAWDLIWGKREGRRGKGLVKGEEGGVGSREGGQGRGRGRGGGKGAEVPGE